MAPYEVTLPYGICLATSCTSSKKFESVFPDGRTLLSGFELVDGFLVFFVGIIFTLTQQVALSRLWHIPVIEWTMEATITATISALKMVFSGQHHKTAFVIIIIDAFNQFVLHVKALLTRHLYPGEFRSEV